MRRFVLAIALAAGAARRGSAQVLTLSEAFARAGRSAYPVRIAEGESAAAGGRSVSALRGILPTVRVEGSYLRTTDPLGAFGAALRQRALTPASFDPAALNFPAAIGNVATSMVLELPIFNADAWYGRRAAGNGRVAALATEAWTRETTATDVAQAWFGAVLASERIAALEAGLIAAKSHVHQAESLLRNGDATRSDALIATVKAGEIEATLVGAVSDATIARRRLALAMGTPDDTAWTLPPSFPAAERVRALAAQSMIDGATVSERPDVRAASAMRAAANADLGRARSLYLPRVNSFARLDWNAAAAPFGGRDSWTVGVMATWTPFAGASEIGEIRSAAGHSSGAEALAAAASAQAALDLQQADAALQVASARLAIAERAVDQSAEAHRIVGRKYEGGLATVVELLDAAAVETQARLAFADARFEIVAAVAARLRARGLSLAPLTMLDQ